MRQGLYIINPKSIVPSYYTADNFEALGLSPMVEIGDLACTTLAAMASDYFDITICEQSVTPVDFDTPADIIAITGKGSQYDAMVSIADKFLTLGKVVVIGGPLASLAPELLRAHCNVLVIGEIEEISDQIFSDLQSGCELEEYTGTKPNLALTPIPRWDLYPHDKALTGAVQTTRGCPFSCEFCDVIQYVGRNQRAKPIENVLAELDLLHKLGFRSVFLSDDNLTVVRARARILMEAIKEWNYSKGKSRLSFSTQLSIDTVADEKLLELCAEAGLTIAFIGIETPNTDSLKEAVKRQNIRKDLISDIHKFLSSGISIMAGMIVGFDADTPEIFRTQFDFAMSTQIPIFNLSSLVAPASTPLCERLNKLGRIKEVGAEGAGAWDSNITGRPHLSDDQLSIGLRWLINKLYSPKSFTTRIEGFLDIFDPHPNNTRTDGALDQLRRTEISPLFRNGRLSKLKSWGSDEEKLLKNISILKNEFPKAKSEISQFLHSYIQIRYMCETSNMWEPELEKLDSPPFVNYVTGGKQEVLHFR